jgi:hypothetical protein
MRTSQKRPGPQGGCARNPVPDLLLRAMLTDDAYGAPFPTVHSGDSPLSGPSNDSHRCFFLGRVLIRHAALKKNSNLPAEDWYSRIHKVLLETADNDEHNGYFPCTASVVCCTLGQLLTEENKAALQLLKGRNREHSGRVRLDRRDKTLTRDRNGKVRKWIHKDLLWASLTGLRRQGDTEREFSTRVMEEYDNIPAEDVKMFLNNRNVFKALSVVCTDSLGSPVTNEEVARLSTSFLHNLQRSTIQVSTHEVEVFRRTLQEEKKFSDVASIFSVESMRSRATQCVALESIFRMLTYLREKQQLPVVLLAILWAVNKNIRHKLGVSFFDRFKSESFEGKVVVHPEVRAYWDDIKRLHLSWNLSFCADETQTNLHWTPLTTHFKSTHSQNRLTSTIDASTGGGGGVPATDPPRPVPVRSRIKPPLPLIFTSHLQQLPCPDVLRGTHTHTPYVCIHTHTRVHTHVGIYTGFLLNGADIQQGNGLRVARIPKDVYRRMSPQERIEIINVALYARIFLIVSGAFDALTALIF